MGRVKRQRSLIPFGTIIGFDDPSGIACARFRTFALCPTVVMFQDIDLRKHGLHADGYRLLERQSTLVGSFHYHFGAYRGHKHGLVLNAFATNNERR
jgi:hypothetical protein